MIINVNVNFSVSVSISVGISICIIINQILGSVLNNYIKLFTCRRDIRMRSHLYYYEMPKPYLRNFHKDCVVKLWTVLKQIG